VALATDRIPPSTGSAATLRLPVGDLVVLFGILVFGTNILEVTMRGGALAQLVGPLYMLAYLLGFLFVALSGAVPRALFANPLLAVLIFLPTLSALWSVDPGMTHFRNLMLLGTTAFGLFIGWHYDRTRLIRLLGIGVSINLAISAFLIVAVPSIGIDSSLAWGGTWIGAYMHKNGFGAAVGVALLILFYAIAVSSGVWRLAFLAFFALGCVLLVGSRSATALVVAIIGIMLALWFRAWQAARGLTLATLLAALLFAPLLAVLLAQQDLAALLFDGLEKDATVSGRTDIWRLVWPYIMDRFWLGYGYGSFWQPGFPWFNQLQARLFYAPFYSHNGIVELWIGGGALAVGIAILVFLKALGKSAILALGDPRAADAAFPFVFFVSFALRNITEASLLQGNDLLWVLFVALLVSTSKSVVIRLRPAASTDGGHG
jgi:O-antigen ligase